MSNGCIIDVEMGKCELFLRRVENHEFGFIDIKD